MTPIQIEAIHLGRADRVERARARGGGKLASYRTQAIAVSAVVALLRLLPVDAASALGGWFGRTFLRRALETDAVIRSIRVPYPDGDPARIDTIITGMADNVVRVLAELAHLRAFCGSDNPRVVLAGAEHVAAARQGGRGVLFVTGHFGNWEIAGLALRAMGLDGVFSVMPPSNPYVFDLLARARLEMGLSEQVNAGEGVYRAFRKNLRAGRVAIMLADQRLPHGLMVPFLGRAAVTNVVPARLARTLGIAVIPMVVRRVPGRTAHFEVRFEAPLEFAGGDSDADERAFLARINDFYAREILRDPAQWLWVDPRWDPA